MVQLGHSGVRPTVEQGLTAGSSKEPSLLLASALSPVLHLSPCSGWAIE